MRLTGCAGRAVKTETNSKEEIGGKNMKISFRQEPPTAVKQFCISSSDDETF